MERSNHVIGVFFDMFKAFDSIDHNILIDKLQNIGVRGIPLKLLASFPIGNRLYSETILYQI